MVVAVRSGERRENLTAINRAIRSSIENVHNVGVLWIREEMCVIPGALAKAMIVVNQAPVLATIVRSIESAFVIFDQRVHAIRLC